MEEFRANGQTYRWNPENKKIYVVTADHAQNFTGKKADSLDEAKEVMQA